MTLPDADLAVEMQCLARDRVTAEIVTALRADGVEPILLKGASFKEWLYGDGTPRAYRDTDLLVPPDALPAAERRLAAMGFEHDPLDDLAFDKPWHAHEWMRPSDGSAVDVHRTLIGVGVDHHRVWGVLSEMTAPVSVGGITMTSLDEDARTLHVALHAAQDGGRRARSLEDLERALAIVPIDCWQGAAAIARQLQATEALAAGLRLRPEGAAIADRLGLPSHLNLDVRLRASGAPRSAIALSWFMRQPLRGKLGFLATKLFPPPAFMRAWTPVARRGPAGLAAAYAVRLVWLCTRLPGAVAAWRATRRSDR